MIDGAKFEKLEKEDVQRVSGGAKASAAQRASFSRGSIAATVIQRETAATQKAAQAMECELRRFAK